MAKQQAVKAVAEPKVTKKAAAPKAEKKAAPKVEPKVSEKKAPAAPKAAVAANEKIQVLVSKKVHLYSEEKGKAACGAAQGEDMELRAGSAEEVTCKLCQRSLNK